MLLPGKYPNDPNLVRRGPSGDRLLAEAKGIGLGNKLYLLAPDEYGGGNDYSYWRYSGDKFSKVEQESRDRYVFTESNTVAKGDSAMECRDIRSVTSSSPGRALGLLSDESTGTTAIVRYQNGHWYLVIALPGYTQKNVPRAAWFLDERNMVAIGSDKVTRLADGVLSQQSLVVAGHEYPAEALSLVWGNSMGSYWVADSKGNVFAFSGEKWSLLARGPDFKADEKFKAMWACPEGSVIAVTEEAVYCFE